MKNLKWVLGVSILTMLVLSGCSFGKSSPVEGKTAAEVLNEALMNSSEITKANFEMSAKGEVTPPKDAGEETLNLELKMDGAFDAPKPEELKFSFNIEGKGNLDTKKEESMKAAMMMDAKALYFKLDNVSDFDGSLPEAMVKPFLGKWWKISLEGIPGFSELFAQGADAKLKELYKEVQLFKDVKYLGEEGENGKTYYAFDATLDPEAVKKFMERSAEIQGQKLDENAKKSLDELWKNLTIDGEIWVEKEKMRVAKFDGNFEFSDKPDGFQAEFDIVESIEESADVKIEFPADATEFDPLSLLGLPPSGVDVPLEDEAILDSEASDVPVLDTPTESVLP